jgi:hypothetical protein
MMPSLIQAGMRIQDVKYWRTRFKTVRINQVFYAEGRWWQKRTTRTAIPADDTSNKPRFFRSAQMIRVLDETKPLLKPVPGISYDEFIARSAL